MPGSRSNTAGSGMPVMASAWAWARMRRAGSSMPLDSGEAIHPDNGGMHTTSTLHRLEENLGAANVERTPDDPRTIEEAASKITLHGDRYPSQLQQRVGR